MPYYHKPANIEQHYENFKHQFNRTREHMEQAMNSKQRIDFETLQISLKQLQDESGKFHDEITNVLK